jgi:RNA polymerase sigma-32 factor
MAMSVLSVAPEGNLTHYLQEIRKFPMLSAEEELALARQWRDRQEPAAAHKLITSHLRLAAKMAMGYRGYGLPLGELIGEANVGLTQAVRRFDPERGFRLATYAMWWIRAAINEYVLHNWSLVKMGTTAAQKKLFFNLRRLKGQMQAIDESDLRPEQVTAIAHALSVPEQDVVSMNQRLTAPNYSLNVMVGDASESEWQDWLADERDNPEVAFAEQEEAGSRSALLANALTTLKERERHILTERRLKDEPQTLEELSQQYGVSRERVRQIEARAFEKVQKAMQAQITERRLQSLAANRSSDVRLAEAAWSRRGSFSQAETISAASGPFTPWRTLTFTGMPCSRLRPERAAMEACTKMSCVPISGVTKPKPFRSFHHFTTPQTLPVVDA